MRIDLIKTKLPPSAQLCEVCGSEFTTGPVIAMLRWGHGKAGPVCSDCMSRGESNIKIKLQQRAREFRAMAYWLDNEVKAGIDAPTPEEWRAALEEARGPLH